MIAGSAAAKLRAWKADPELYVAEVFRATPDKWQRKALRALVGEKRRIALKACKGPGKSCFLAWAIWWFLTCFKHPRVAVTSITEENLKDNLWTELAMWRGTSKLLLSEFEWTQKRIFSRSSPQTWWCSFRTWPKQADQTRQAATLSGLHAKNVMAVLDESSEIPNAVMTTADAILSTIAPGDKGLVLQAGNPTMLEGPLYDACSKAKEMWEVIEITGDPEDPDRSPRISMSWAKEQIALHGRDNPWVMANVLGQFPPASLNILLGPEEVNTAMRRHLRDDEYYWAQKRLGIDVARFGDDASVIFPRQGRASFHPVVMRNFKTHEIAARVAKNKADWGSELEIVDSTGGYGAGVEDSLEQAMIGALPVNFAGKPMDLRYFNKRCEMWFLMANWIKSGGALPPNDTLLKELTTPQYMFHQGRFRIEEKDQIKARLGFSPNHADALALTFAVPDMPAEERQYPHLEHQSAKAKTEYDPLDENR
jgi:hypothetical protein